MFSGWRLSEILVRRIKKEHYDGKTEIYKMEEIEPENKYEKSEIKSVKHENIEKPAKPEKLEKRTEKTWRLSENTDKIERKSKRKGTEEMQKVLLEQEILADKKRKSEKRWTMKKIERDVPKITSETPENQPPAE